MLPFITIGSLEIETYPLVYALAFFAFTSLALAAVRGSDNESARTRVWLLLSAMAFMVGMYLPGLVQAWIESLRSGGPIGPVQSRVYYGLAAGLLVTIWYNRGRTRAEIGAALDGIIRYFPLAYAIARLGCLAAGCCGGAETGSALGMYAPDDHGHWANRYPTQLISAGVQLGLFVLLAWLTRWRERHPGTSGPRAWLNRPGTIFYIYLLAFCLERFSLDFLRYDYRPILGPLSLPQLLMLAGLAAAALGLARVKPAI